MFHSSSAGAGLWSYKEVVIWSTIIKFAFKVIKFYQGLTSVSVGLEPQEELEFPDVTFCLKSGWKEEALSEMGHGKDFMKIQMGNPFMNQKIDDIDEIWEKSTHNWKELPVLWLTDTGNLIYYRF